MIQRLPAPESFDANIATANAGVPAPGQINFFDVVRRRWFLILMLAVIGGFLGYLYQTQRQPMYQASCRVLVERKQNNLPIDFLSMMGSSSSPMDQLLLTHMEIIRSPMVVSEAAKDQRLASLTHFAGKEAAGTILMGLSINRPKARDNVVIPNVLELVYRCEEQKESPIVLEAVVKAYKDYVSRTEMSSDTEVVDLLQKTQETLSNQIKAAQTEYDKSLEKASAWAKDQKVTLLRDEKGDFMSLDQKNLLEVERRLQMFKIQEQEMTSKLTKLDEAKAKGGDIRGAVELMIGRQSDIGNYIASDIAGGAKNQILALRMEEQSLLNFYGDEHPKVKDIRNRIKMMEEFDRTERNEAQQKLANRPKPVSKNMVEDYIQSLRLEADTLRDMQVRLTAQITNIKPKVDEFLVYQEKDKAHRLNINRQQSLYDVMVKRLQEIKLGRNEGAIRTQIMAPPAPAGEVAGLIFRAVLVGAALGFMLGFGVSYLAEVADKNFRTPEEVRLTLGVPIMAHIPPLPTLDKRDKNKSKKLHKSLAAIHSSKSLAAEAFRGVRTALYFSTAEEPHKAIQITSPEPSDGKTTLASNLAIAIAQSGKRVLLVDADMRRPKIDKLFSVPNNQGLSTVLDGKTTLGSAIVPIEDIPNLSVITSGPTPNNPSEQLTGENFADMIEQCKAQFEIVLIDTPPLLPVTDAAVVAPRVDGVILALKLAKNARIQAVRAMEVLSNINCKVLGVVVNGKPDRRGYGRYGRYGYSGAHYGADSGFGFGDSSYGGYGGDSFDNYVGTGSDKNSRRR
jgi:capsular exopolysaccharide synthesis family protein